MIVPHLPQGDIDKHQTWFDQTQSDDNLQHLNEGLYGSVSYTLCPSDPPCFQNSNTSQSTSTMK